MECIPSNLNTSNYGLIGMSISRMHQLTKVLEMAAKMWVKNKDSF